MTIKFKRGWINLNMVNTNGVIKPTFTIHNYP